MSNAGRAAYGSLARHFASCFAPDEPIVVIDHTAAAEGLAECVRRRFLNARFFVRLISPREGVLRTHLVAPTIMKAFQDIDERYTAAQQSVDGTLSANGRPLREIGVYAPNVLRLLQAAVRLSDGVVVSSHAERRRVQELIKCDPPVVFRNLTDPHVPAAEFVPARTRDAVVIWAPHLDGDAASPLAIALADIHAVKLLVSRTPPAIGGLVEWVNIDRSAEALSRARAVIDANSCNADSSVALVQWNVPLVVDAESGAQERIANVCAFDHPRLDSLYDAVVTALGMPQPTIHDFRDSGEHYTAPQVYSGPLVSVVIPTFDRPTLLRYALESCRRQTYRNLEVIVAVGGGRRFDDIAREYDEVRFVHLDANVPAASLNAAFAQARGEYVAILNDDDVYFPDHISLLAGALERSGAMAAHADVLTAFLRGSDEQWLLYGFESNMSRPAKMSSLLVANYVGAMSVMVRRSCIGKELYDMAIPLYRDYALLLRLSREYDIVHVERITSCYTVRNQGREQQTQLTSQRAAEVFKAIYDAFPAHGRPRLEQQRQQHLQIVGQRGTFSAWAQPAGEVAPIPWPPL